MLCTENVTKHVNLRNQGADMFLRGEFEAIDSARPHSLH